VEKHLQAGNKILWFTSRVLVVTQVLALVTYKNLTLVEKTCDLATGLSV
jgi:hypothetical protein